LVIDFPSENMIKMSDITSNYTESFDFPDK